MNMIKLIIAATALTIGAGAAQAEHQVEWKYGFKGGAPYAVRLSHGQKGLPVYGSPRHHRHASHTKRPQHTR